MNFMHLLSVRLFKGEKSLPTFHATNYPKQIQFIYRINPENLETMGKINMREHVNVVNHTSHPFVMSDRSVSSQRKYYF